MVSKSEKASPLAEALTQLYPLSDLTKEALLQVLRPCIYSKGSLILTPGQRSEYFYFIEKGLMRGYYLEEGKEVTAWIVAEGGVGMATESFYRQTPSDLYLEVLEESIVYRLHYQDFLELRLNYPDYVHFILRFTEEYLIYNNIRLQLLCTRSPVERYKLFDSKYANLRGRLPQSVLASYLNMSYFQISRIRTQLSKV
ncbi:MULTISPECIES: Crp/Fnr family transcriptional regulator [unclassified Siphonobacter]|uniref:Crp/Fnr family transcriptional regulator n=1 Tax=unclassified Siphonobacter TaxID=2635712 RepID=UPI002784ECBF|nr:MULTISPECIES: Crp/Fnr family transcriptional regulator [unclassified Siphonobacter]MDQ1087454.1 CRP-like cAMP-binding protein [Siphonobacter sp. SORGH_AS_1065]MDR6193603.1 CRP-like cAMP-binding protein [Siphonobacter sp. SORGH_AS_0500]